MENKIKILENRILEYLLPAPFLLMPIFDVLAFYLGLSNNTKQFFSIPISIIICIISSYMLLKIIINDSKKNKMRIIISIFLITACYIIALFMFDLNQRILDNTMKFVLWGIPAFVLGLFCYKYNLQKNLLINIERWSIFLLPAAFFFVIRLLLFADSKMFTELRSLGPMNYMGVAYALLPGFVVAIIFVLHANTNILFITNASICKFIRIFMALIFWFAILFTATRGAILCVIFFLIVMLIWAIINKKRVLLTILLLAVVVSTFIAYSFVFLPTVFEDGNRLEATFDTDSTVYSRSAEIRTSEEVLVLYDPAHVKSEVEKLLHENAEYSVYMLRPMLYNLSILEIKENIILGMGPMGFEMKYTMYPHNLLLQSMAELGLMGLLFLIMLIILLVRSIKNIARCYFRFGVIALILAYIPMFMFSGSLWSNWVLLFAIGYSLTQKSGKEISLENEGNSCIKS